MGTPSCGCAADEQGKAGKTRKATMCYICARTSLSMLSSEPMRACVFAAAPDEACPAVPDWGARGDGGGMACEASSSSSSSLKECARVHIEYMVRVVMAAWLVRPPHLFVIPERVRVCA